jgi:hypothetical protein
MGINGQKLASSGFRYSIMKMFKPSAHDLCRQLHNPEKIAWIRGKKLFS